MIYKILRGGKTTSKVLKGIKMMKSITTIPDKSRKTKKKNHKLKNSKKTPPQNLQKNEEAVLSTLQALYDKEQELQEEKDRLLDIEETLKKRIINEIEIKKSTIIDLEDEIPELKQRIEKLAQILEIPVEKKPEN